MLHWPGTNLHSQDGARVGPHALGGPFGKVEGLCGFGHGHAGEETELDQPRSLFVARSEAIECLIQIEHVNAMRGGELCFLEVVPIQGFR